MKIIRIHLLCATLAFCRVASGEQSLALNHATQPLADGVPEVAVVRLRALLADKLSAEEKRVAMTKLGEALVGSGQPAEALTILNDPVCRDLPATKFLQAQALAALERWSEALLLYQQPAATFRADALAGQAESLRALGRTGDALQVLSLLSRDDRWGTRARLRTAELLLAQNDTAGATRELDSIAPKSAVERKERRFLRACIELRLEHRDRAAALFASILKNPEGATHSVLVSTLFGIAEAHLQAGSPGAADDYLEDFIERHPGDPDLPAIFAKLDQLYAAERKQSRHELGRWSREPAQPRRTLAQWYLTRAELRLGRRDRAFLIFEQMRADHLPRPEVAEAFLEYAQLLFEEHRFEEASAILERARALGPAAPLRARIDSLAGRAHYSSRRFDAAAEAFRRAAQSSPASADGALFNTSIAWLQAGDSAQFVAAERDLQKSGGNEQIRGDLELEQALVEAGRSEKKAATSLQNFIRTFPKHPRTSEAWVALAELAFHETPPQIEPARQHLARAAGQQPTAAAQERGDYLVIWIEDAAEKPDEAKVIALANQFLQKHAASALAPDVRLKLAETYYRRQDFASAQTQFSLIAQQNAASPLTEKAQFFAAQSAMQSMGSGSLDRALVMFDEVVKKNGEWKWAARNEQAVIERKLGKTDDALTLYDEVLKGDAKPAEKREALCGRGDIFYELGATDAEYYRRAIESYNQLAAQTGVASHWRNQALFKKGMCLEKLKAPAEALAAFYEIIEDEGRPDRRREFFWFYKAGFNAARLLEEDSKWQPAAAIYEKLAFAGGGRSEEAKARLNRLRLEHFLWDM